MLMCQAYAMVKKDTPAEQSEIGYFGESNDRAIAYIREAVASGFDYGYIKQGFETIAYLTDKSFLSPVSLFSGSERGING